MSASYGRPTISVGRLADFIVLQVLRDTTGGANAVLSEDALAAVREVMASDGVFMYPEAGTTVVVLRHLLAAGRVGTDETAAVIKTSTGQKYLDLFTSVDPPSPGQHRGVPTTTSGWDWYRRHSIGTQIFVGMAVGAAAHLVFGPSGQVVQRPLKEPGRADGHECRGEGKDDQRDRRQHNQADENVPHRGPRWAR